VNDTATKAPNELVTNSLVRYTELPFDAGLAAVITLDNGRDHTKPTTLGHGGLESLAKALDEVASKPGVAATIVTGKPYFFLVGADLKNIGSVRDRAMAHQVAAFGHSVFSKLSYLPMPTFAAINGAAMGGGLELALYASYRSISTAVAAIALPEVFLGIIPGWGGTYLLPHLIGAPNAIKVIVDNPLANNKMLKPQEASDLGIADVIYPAPDFLEKTFIWAAKVVLGQTQVDRRPIDTGEQWAKAVTEARTRVEARVRGAARSAYVALDLIEGNATRTRAEGFAAEDDALADLVMSEYFRAGLYSFDLVQRRAKKPVGAPDTSAARPVTKVGVIGAGLMASQLALLFLKRLEVPVVITDVDQTRIDKGLSFIKDELAKALEKGRMAKTAHDRAIQNLSGSLNYQAFKDADFVIEAVFEELNLKIEIFKKLEGYVSNTATLATNTSSLSVTKMAAELAHPERVVGFHFFNPVAVMPLLEIARGEKTDDATVATAFDVAKKLKKTAILVKDAPAFVVNRLLMRFMGEIFKAVDEGAEVDVADRSVDNFGLPMRVFQLLELVGPGVGYHVSKTMQDAFPDRFYASENMKALIDAKVSPIVVYEGDKAVLAPAAQAVMKVGDKKLTGPEIRTRVLEALADETNRMLEEGVVSEVQDIDLGMITGAGWPFWLGGLSPYLDREGVSEKVNGKRFLPVGVASVP
jgi:3-hydroxyacyl-CoA dehydrogenase/enoyl-CoA hydratase/carnithine racemase